MGARCDVVNPIVAEWVCGLAAGHDGWHSSLASEVRWQPAYPLTAEAALARADAVIAALHALRDRWAAYQRRWTPLVATEGGPRDPVVVAKRHARRERRLLARAEARCDLDAE